VTPEKLRTQKFVVLLAFVAAALSLLAAVLTAIRTGRIEATPLFGGLFMLALGIGGLSAIRRRQREAPPPGGGSS
jgi:hypothetical protein